MALPTASSSMSLADFFHHAFIGALHRLPVAEALHEARLATRACVDYWDKDREHYAVQFSISATQMPIDSISMTAFVSKQLAKSDEQDGQQEPGGG